MHPERDFLLELDQDLVRIHDETPDEETKERLWELICKISERIRKVYRNGEEQ